MDGSSQLSQTFPHKVYVIAGGPCSGKTALVRALAERGYRTVPETAEETIRAAAEAGVPVEQQRLTDPVGFQGQYSMWSGVATILASIATTFTN